MLTLSEVESRVDERIAEALTPEVLSALALKGITPDQAREHIRARVALAMIREFRL